MEPVPLADPVIEIDGLTKRFGDKTAVAGLSLEVRSGEFFGFLGPNGAGKSTTIRILCGLLRPTAGNVRIFGIDVQADPLEVKRRIGILPEDAVLYDRLTPLEHLRFVGRMHGLDTELIDDRSTALLDLMELEPADRGRMIVDQSTGMRKKVSLACALIHGPRLLFLDEPFNGIDAVTVRALRNVLQEAVGRGVTVFFSSHVLEVAQRLCTRIAIIRQGSLHALGTLDEVRQQVGLPPESSLEDAFVALTGERTESAPELDFLG